MRGECSCLYLYVPFPQTILGVCFSVCVSVGVSVCPREMTHASWHVTSDASGYAFVLYICFMKDSRYWHGFDNRLLNGSRGTCRYHDVCRLLRALCVGVLTCLRHRCCRLPNE